MRAKTKKISKEELDFIIKLCGEFAQNNKAKILDKKVYDNGILENIKQSIDFITKRIKVEFVIESAERKEIYQFPEEAYREAVVNAVMHRDYTDKSSDIFVENYNNKIIITNPGGLVKWMKKEDFGKVSKTRNSIISSLLARTKYVEKMGTGILRMNEAMEKAGLSEIDFDFDDYTFAATLHDNESMDKKGIQKTSEKTSEKIIKLLKNQPYMTISELSKAIGVSSRSVERNIRKLQYDKLLSRIGPDKGGYWKVIES